MQKFYDQKPSGLSGAMADLGIDFTGRQHSGTIITTRVLLSLVYKVLSRRKYPRDLHVKYIGREKVLGSHLLILVQFMFQNKVLQ